MEAKEFVRQISEQEPLNPFQIAGMTAVLKGRAADLATARALHVEDLSAVLTILDRAGEEASSYLIGLRQEDSRLTMFLRFSRKSLEELVYLTPFEGRRLAILEDLVPVLLEIPNWLDLVEVLSRYALDRDDKSMGRRLEGLMEIILAFLFAAARQPFDLPAREKAEHSLSRLAEGMLKSADPLLFSEYTPFLTRVLDFLTQELFPGPVASFDRRVAEVMAIRVALKRQSVGQAFQPVVDSLTSKVDRLAAQAILTAFGEVRTLPRSLVEDLNGQFVCADFPEKEQFRKEVLERVNLQSDVEIDRLKRPFLATLQRETSSMAGWKAFPGEEADWTGPFEDHIRQGIDFIRRFGEEWTTILAAFEQMIDSVPLGIQEAFSRILAAQVLAVDKPDVRKILVDGLCRFVVGMESRRRQSSTGLVHFFVTNFLETATHSSYTEQALSALEAIEALGVTLARNSYFLMARELIELLKAHPLIGPKQSRFTVEDDDTGEPLVIAEETRANTVHVQHIKGLLRIIASGPRIMRALVPYLTVQLELGRVRMCDEDLIQYEISALLRANSPVTHFLVRTLIKAIPYSFKAIGPLDDLRQTAAGLAKELANRGVKPVGNFLGKLRGDIHWRGSVENFHFCVGIIRYLASGDPEYLADWMPRESMPYLTIDQWARPAEALAITEICQRIFADLGIEPSSGDGIMRLIRLDTSRYRTDQAWPEFSRRVVLDMIDLLRGLHSKYFVEQQSSAGASVEQDLERLERTVAERGQIKNLFLVPDIRDPIAAPVHLTEGRDDCVGELERIKRDLPGTPVILRARKTGHAYAQMATYMEKRFEAFNRDLALEALQETLATTINNTCFATITVEQLPEALRFLDTLVQGLAVNGHSSYYLEQAGRDLRRAGSLGLSFDKVRDLVKVVKKELDDIHDFYRNWFENPFDLRLSQCPMEELPRKLKDLTTLKEIPETDFYQNYLKTLYISDLQARDGNLRVMETFLDKVELFLNERLAESNRRVPNRGRPFPRKKYFYFPDEGPISPCRIGVKASLLWFADNTPPYFVITTDQPLKETQAMLCDREFLGGLTASVEKLEAIYGKKFGDPSNPALFSVRSGSRMSMPGMMVTLTNVGINDAIARSLAAKAGKWFAYDCYRRFLEEFATAVFGISREEFQDIIDERKKRWGIIRKALFTGDQMEEIAFAYKGRLAALAPDAVKLLDEGKFMEVLVRCAMAVLHSFEGHAARKYREAAGIDGNWRTPAIVQFMAYGNMQYESSGTGVMSYDPFTMELVGEFSSGDQGTDVVDGKVATIPVYDLYGGKETLASLMPEAWKRLSSTVIGIGERLHMQVNVEYTIEKSAVYILQIRKRRDRKERVPSLERAGYRVIARGTGVCGKIFRGLMVTDRNQIAPFRHINKARSIVDSMNETLPEGEKLDGFIFVVNDPIPEDIMEEVFSLPVNTALVSRLGGSGAHAADIARSLNKVYVAQVGEIVKFAGKPETIRLPDLNLVVGTKMVIHGQTGEIALYR